MHCINFSSFRSFDWIASCITTSRWWWPFMANGNKKNWICFNNKPVNVCISKEVQIFLFLSTSRGEKSATGNAFRLMKAISLLWMETPCRFFNGFPVKTWQWNLFLMFFIWWFIPLRSVMRRKLIHFWRPLLRSFTCKHICKEIALSSFKCIFYCYPLDSYNDGRQFSYFHINTRTNLNLINSLCLRSK